MELVRCRLCGGEACDGIACDTAVLGMKHVVECECGVQTGLYNTREQAYKAWNRLMSVTLDELREIHENSYKCGSCILKEKSKHCVVADLLPNQEHIESAVHRRRAKKNG